MKNTKLFILALLTMTCISKLQAQSASVAAGGVATGSGGSSSYSIGQVIYITASGGGGTSSQGVQIPFEITTLSGKEFSQISLKMLVYPNPTTSFVNLKINNFDFQDLNYQLIDLNGKEIANQKIAASETAIELQNLSNAIYLLNVNDKNKTIKTFKIIKN